LRTTDFLRIFDEDSAIMLASRKNPPMCDWLSELPLKRLCLFRKLLRIAYFELTKVLELPANSWQQYEMWKAQEVPFGSVLNERNQKHALVVVQSPLQLVKEFLAQRKQPWEWNDLSRHTLERPFVILGDVSRCRK
jgi:hypothetical protein